MDDCQKPHVGFEEHWMIAKNDTSVEKILMENE